MLDPPSGPSELWTSRTRHPTRLIGLVMDRTQLYRRIDARVDRMVAAGAADEVARQRRGRRRPDRAQGARLRRAPGRRRRGDEAPDPPVRPPPADVDAKARRRRARRRHRAVARRVAAALRHDRRVRFEKWQALGNDYLILEAPGLPWPLTAARIRRICDPHPASAPTASCCSRRPPTPTSSPGCGSSTPTAPRPSSRATVPGRRCLYLRHRGFTDLDEFAITTAGGRRSTRDHRAETRARSTSGRAATASRRLPVRPPRRPRASCYADGKRWRFQHVAVGNPQCAIRCDWLGGLDLPAIGPEIERHEVFPNRTNVSWFRELERGVIRARIFERGVGETISSGTGATGAAVAYHLDGGPPAVTVKLDGGELQIDIGADLRVGLTGWAVPVFRGELGPEFLEELAATNEGKRPPRAHPALPVRRARAQGRRQARRRHRRDQPRHRRPRHADLPADRRGRRARRRRPRHPPLPVQPRPRRVPRGRSSPSTAALRGRARRRDRGDAGDRRQGMHLQPQPRLPRPRRRRPRRRPGLSRLHRRPAPGRRRGGADAARSRAPASSPTSTPIDAETRRRARLLFVNYPNNPTGAVVPDGFFERLVEFGAAQRHPDRPRQRLLARPPTTATSPRPSWPPRARRDVGVEVFSLSKGYNMTGWRCAAILGNRRRDRPLLAPEDEHRLRALRGGPARRRRRARSRGRRLRGRDERRLPPPPRPRLPGARGDRRRRHPAAGDDLRLGARPVRLRLRCRLLRARARGGRRDHLARRRLRARAARGSSASP